MRSKPTQASARRPAFHQEEAPDRVAFRSPDGENCSHKQARDIGVSLALGTALFLFLNSLPAFASDLDIPWSPSYHPVAADVQDLAQDVRYSAETSLPVINARVCSTKSLLQQGAKFAGGLLEQLGALRPILCNSAARNSVCRCQAHRRATPETSYCGNRAGLLSWAVLSSQ